MCRCDKCVRRIRGMTFMIECNLSLFSSGVARSARNLFLIFNTRTCVTQESEFSHMAMSKTFRNGDKVQWINRTLTEAELKSVDAWDVPLAGLFDAITELIDDGYRITFSFDEPSKCPLVCLFSPSTHKNHPNCGLSARSSDATDALKCLLWKHYILFEGAWPVDSRPPFPTRG